MPSLHCLADVCLIPVGTPTASVSDYVTQVVKLVKESGLEYALHSAGTTIEGPWDEVMALIGTAHETLHKQGVVRIQSDIRVGTRTDKVQHPEDKVRVVHEKLARLEKESSA